MVRTPADTDASTPVRQAGAVPRIVAGWGGSLQLRVPSAGTRPTSDRTREALFSMLEARGAVRGAAVLDLYAGSGALGLEALSRGAASAVLVDRAPAAVRALRANVATLRRAAPGNLSVEVVQRSARAFLAAARGPFDLVLLDPPYDLDDEAVTDDLGALRPLLGPGAVVLVERSARSPAPRPPVGLVLDRTRVHGDSAIHALVPAEP